MGQSQGGLNPREYFCKQEQVENGPSVTTASVRLRLAASQIH